MALKKASTMLSRLKTAFTKPSSEPLTSTSLKADAVTTSTSQTVTEAPSRASQDTIRAESRASKAADADTTKPLPEIAEQDQPTTSPKTTTIITTTPPPAITTPTTLTTHTLTIRRPRDIMALHASLLPTPGPQRHPVDLAAQLHPPPPLTQPSPSPLPSPQPLKFTSPLPIHPFAAPLTLAHFLCPTKHHHPSLRGSTFRPSSNAHAPTLCTTCHRSGDKVLACCTCCGVRICGRCVGLLGGGTGEGDGGGLERVLGELVGMGWWRGLDGQG